MMTPEQASLWQRINSFEIDLPGVDFTFAARLARENGWTVAYANRVIAEYKRFLFLCCITPTGVTPSDPVDQAWHLHLTYTRSYWVDLCKNTLQQEIHHNPTKGGNSEAAKFDGFYTGTHQLYTDKFGITPPADIWADNKTRFSDINFQRVNVRKYWLIKKPVLSAFTVVGVCLIISCILFIQASFVDNLFMFGILCAIAIGIGWGIYKNDGFKNDGRDDNSTGGDSGCGGATGGGWWGSDGHHGGHGHHDSDGGDSGCSSGCSGCSSSGCSGCGGGGD